MNSDDYTKRQEAYLELYRRASKQAKACPDGERQTSARNALSWARNAARMGLFETASQYAEWALRESAHQAEEVAA